MCLRINRRRTTSAGVPSRPRPRFLRCRFARASYTAATICSSAKTWSACAIQSSRRSLTSSAISPSPKRSCARRISIMSAPRPSSVRLRTQELMIELADTLDRPLQLLIIVEPAANLGDAFAANAELLHAAAGVGHRQHEHPVSLAARAFRTVFRMPHGALQQRASKQLAGNRQLADKLVARTNGSIANHSLE